MKNYLKASLFICSFLLTGTLFAQSKKAEDEVLGIWLNGTKKGHVEMFKKPNGKYYGKLIWLTEPNNPDGSPKLDVDNEDESLRTRPVMGMEVLLGFEYDEDDEQWQEGTLYNPEDGETYSGYLELQKDGTLKVRGFIGFSLLGKTQIWERIK